MAYFANDFSNYISEKVNQCCLLNVYLTRTIVLFQFSFQEVSIHKPIPRICTAANYFSFFQQKIAFQKAKCTVSWSQIQCNIGSTL